MILVDIKKFVCYLLLCMPIKERRTKILLMLFLFSDVNFSPVEITTLLQKIFDLSFNQKTKGTLSSLLKEGFIEKGPSEGESNSHYKLTKKGFLQLCLEFPFFRFLLDEWDGTWRIISYEIPEKKRDLRDRLRREMRGWGLGPWHRSFWITPHPIMGELKELVFGKEEATFIQAFEATHVFGDMEILVEKVWSKSALETRYRDLFKVWHEILSKDTPQEERMKEILYGYIQVLRDDPGLPSSLVGRKWIGFEAFDIFKEVRSILIK